MSSFSLLKLPHLAVEQVIENLGLSEAIDFSLCSKRCTRIIKSRKEIFTTIDVSVHHSSRSLHLRTGKKTIWWIFSSYSNDLKRFTRFRNINGVEMRFDDQNERKSVCYHPNYEFASIKFAEFLIECFKCSIGNISIQRHLVQDFQSLISLIKTCNRLDLLCSGIPSDVDYRFFLETMESMKWAKIQWKNNWNFEFLNDQIFKCDQLEITASWITAHQIINMDLSTALIRFTKLSETDMISIVKHWFYSGNLKLTWLHIGFQKNHLENREFDDIPVTHFLEDHRGKFYQLPHKQLDCSNGVDILRRDGIRATVVFEGNNFYFVVRH